MSTNRITLMHGAGGSIMHNLIKDRILGVLKPYTGFEVPLAALDDAGVCNGIVFTTDSYTVKPLFFNGGDIGRLAVSGTVNDIAVIGGKPIALSLALIIEEGFMLDDLDRILASVEHTCKEAGVDIITGDTKVVERGSLDRLIINTSGIGTRNPLLDANLKHVNRDIRWLLDSNIRAGDRIIVSGSIADHGMAVLSAREGYGFASSICSDVRPLNRLIDRALEAGGVVCMKDPTRGGLADLLNTWAERSHVGIMVYEDRIPVKESVRAAASFLGIDPLEVGNEGKVCIATVADRAEHVLAAIRECDEGRDAQIIGEATDLFDVVAMRTVVGGTRIVTRPVGDPVPRIC
ncbi:MAG: hydrogenase expression/formation protein HypE [Candidatus Nitrosocaldus sp.]|nr:hydrogenase expression/formation protein HypE [Candidatus Nitrosocaldus sp.]MDW8000816.1 hydrogenase expression/formation protein HypE [Candidatus Nitrosocaldus sp.]